MSSAMVSSSNNNARYVTESQRRIDALSIALSRMQTTTSEASRCCDGLTKRARNLDSLTSPASDASAMLSKAGGNISGTITLMKDALEKFETTADCEPSIQKLHKGIVALEESQRGARVRATISKNQDTGGVRANGKVICEQDVYAAADSMEIIRDAFGYFLDRRSWKSAMSALGELERVHKIGVSSMCRLVTCHLSSAGALIQPKHTNLDLSTETSNDTRARLAAALQNRDLMKSIGEYEEGQSLEPRSVREMRAVFECLGGDGFQLGKPRTREIKSNLDDMIVPASKVIRNEKVGSGVYFNKVKSPIKTGYPHLDAYGEIRKTVAHDAMDGYYRGLRVERKKKHTEKNKSISKMAVDGDEGNDADNDADAAARDAVRCLEHAMVVVAGEKSVYRTIVGPSLTQGVDEEVEISPLYKQACVSTYSHIAATVIDRTLDITETVFLKECGIGQSSGAGATGSTTSPLTARAAASGVAAGLRMLDGVRMLGPSLAKLCEIQIDGKKSPTAPENMAVSSTLCIAIHRTTVKNCARTLENLAKAIKEDTRPVPADARIALVTTDVVRSVRLLSPYKSAYKSVTKRRALPWDPNIGEEAGELDAYVRFLITKLLSSLQHKGITYARDAGADAMGKSNIFMVNNTFYLLKQLGPSPASRGKGKDDEEKESYRIESSWFADKVNKIFESEKNKYLSHWEELNKHLSSVDSKALEFQKDNSLSLESGRMIKARFGGFNDDFEQVYELHKHFSIIDSSLRDTLIKDVKVTFLPRYKSFYEKYSQVQFSKKHMEEYLKFKPSRVNSMLSELYAGSA